LQSISKVFHGDLLTKLKNYDQSLKNLSKPPAFVLGKYSVTGLGISRALGRLKIPVFWLNKNPKAVGFLSKYCKGIVCPNIVSHEKEYIEMLLKIGKSLNHKGVLFPIGDTEVSAILRNKKELEKYYHIPIADFKITEILLNKKKFYQTLQKHKIPHATTFFPKDSSELESIIKKVRYPCIIKPVHSEEFRFEFNTKFFKAKSNRELIKEYNKAVSKNLEVMVQEIIPGDAPHMFGLNAYYNKDFVPNGIFMYRRIREWPPVHGNGVLIENVDIPELEKIVTPFINKIKFYGIIDAEFKKDPRNGTFNLIEINPRSWMQISFPLKLGVNLPYITYLDSLGKDVDQIIPKKERVKWFYMFQDIFPSIQSLVSSNISFRNWIRTYKGKKEYAIFALDDPLPLFLGFFRIIRYLTRY